MKKLERTYETRVSYILGHARNGLVCFSFRPTEDLLSRIDNDLLRYPSVADRKYFHEALINQDGHDGVNVLEGDSIEMKHVRYSSRGGYSMVRDSFLEVGFEEFRENNFPLKIKVKESLLMEALDE